jgi:hypothetical protein
VTNFRNFDLNLLLVLDGALRDRTDPSYLS